LTFRAVAVRKVLPLKFNSMKKFIYIVPILTLILSPAASFAVSVSPSVVYLDQPGDQGAIVCANNGDEDFSVAVFRSDEYAGNTTSCDDQPLFLYNASGGAQFNSSDIGDGIVAGQFVYVSEVATADIGDCDTLSNCEAAGSFINTFSVAVLASAPPAGVIGFPPLAAPLRDRLSDTIADPGLQAILLFVISVPTVFWIIVRIRKLFPSPDPKNKDR